MGKPIDPEKLRDMMRSILPSRARKSARERKALENRKVRRGGRGDLRRRDIESESLRRDTNHREMVDIRRGADKLNHFLRWCRALTAGMSTPQALNFVRALLPRTLIGDHAYGHWYYPRMYGRNYYPRHFPKQEAQGEYDRTRHRLARILREDPNALAELNARVKSCRKPDQPPPRMLFGIHDVDAYVRDVFRHTATCSKHPEKRCLLELIEQHAKGGRDGRPSSFQRFSAPYRSGSTFTALPSASVTMNRSSYAESTISGIVPPKAVITSRVVFECPTTSTVPPACFSLMIFTMSAA